jgi:hypothetical protein
MLAESTMVLHSQSEIGFQNYVIPCSQHSARFMRPFGVVRETIECGRAGNHERRNENRGVIRKLAVVVDALANRLLRDS